MQNKKILKCMDCGTSIYVGSIRCKNCSNKSRRIRHQKRCIDCNILINYNSERCISCSNTFYKKGRPLSKQHKINVINANKRRTGTKLSMDVKIKMGKCKMGGLNGMWIGDNVTYKPLHSWIRRHKPKPLVCEKCNNKPPYDLANISGQYKRDINDFRWLCRGCHMESDDRLEKLKIRMKNLKKPIINGILKCSRCNKYKVTSDFYRNSYLLSGHCSQCKICCKASDRQRYLKNKELASSEANYEVVPKGNKK